jgi:hypothetical protein
MRMLLQKERPKGRSFYTGFNVFVRELQIALILYGILPI